MKVHHKHLHLARRKMSHIIDEIYQPRDRQEK